MAEHGYYFARKVGAETDVPTAALGSLRQDTRGSRERFGRIKRYDRNVQTDLLGEHIGILGKPSLILSEIRLLARLFSRGAILFSNSGATLNIARSSNGSNVEWRQP